MKLPRKAIQKDRAKNKSSGDHQYLKHRQAGVNKKDERESGDTEIWKGENFMKKGILNVLNVSKR